MMKKAEKARRVAEKRNKDKIGKRKKSNSDEIRHLLKFGSKYLKLLFFMKYLCGLVFRLGVVLLLLSVKAGSITALLATAGVTLLLLLDFEWGGEINWPARIISTVMVAGILYLCSVYQIEMLSKFSFSVYRSIFCLLILWGIGAICRKIFLRKWKEKIFVSGCLYKPHK